MHPKHKLILLIVLTLTIITMLVWCIHTHNVVGAVVDGLVLLYYIPMYIATISQLKAMKQ